MDEFNPHKNKDKSYDGAPARKCCSRCSGCNTLILYAVSSITKKAKGSVTTNGGRQVYDMYLHMPNPNFGRRYYQCTKCKHFEWVDGTLPEELTLFRDELAKTRACLQHVLEALKYTPGSAEFLAAQERAMEEYAMKP